MTAILTLSVDPETNQFLSTQGATLVECAHTTDAVCVAGAGCDAVLFGMDSRLNIDTVSFLRRRGINAPAVWIAPGPRNDAWRKSCVQFLRSGGDDVLVGRSTPQEVEASLAAVLRRQRAVPVIRFEHDSQTLEIRPTTGEVRANEQPVALHFYEQAILIALANSRMYRRTSVIFEDLYRERPESSRPDESIVGVHICKLRKRLGPAACLLQSTHGKGYRLLGRVS